MSQGASTIPISIFLNRIIAESGLSIAEFVRSLGYRNIERGLRRLLEPWLAKGEGNQRIIKQIASTYPARADELYNAVAEAEAIIAVEADAAWIERCRAEQAKFVPYLHVEDETTVPNGITLFGASGGRWNLIEIPHSILSLPLEEQLTALPGLMQAYSRQFNRQCPFFGAVTGFRFVRLLDYFQFDKDSVFVDRVEKPFRRGQASVSLR
jgi:hypothetical protein